MMADDNYDDIVRDVSNNFRREDMERIMADQANSGPDLEGSLKALGEAALRTKEERDDLLEAAKLALEGIEVLDDLMASIERHGNYSVESTLGFLNGARCARLRLTEAIAKAEGE